MIRPTDISNIIAREDDFGHEMRVGRVLRGYWDSETLHGGTYSDARSNKARQFDFRWNSTRDNLTVSIAVECKNIRSEAPIIISGCKRTPGEAFHELIESRKGGRFQTARGPVFLDVESTAVVRKITGNESIYSPESFVGKSVLQIKPEANKSRKDSYVRVKDSEIYDKWSQALASSVDLVQFARRFAARFSVPHMFTIVLPVVVVPNDVLWQVEYSINGELVGEPVQKDECEFFVAWQAAPAVEFADSNQPYTLSHLHFVTLNGFGAFLLKVTGDQDWRKLAFDEETIAASRAERLA